MAKQKHYTETIDDLGNKMLKADKKLGESDSEEDYINLKDITLAKVLGKVIGVLCLIIIILGLSWIIKYLLGVLF